MKTTTEFQLVDIDKLVPYAPTTLAPTARNRF